MEQNSFSLIGVSHCIRDFDLTQKSSSLILRHIPKEILSKADKIPLWSTTDFLKCQEKLMMKFGTSKNFEWKCVSVFETTSPVPYLRLPCRRRRRVQAQSDGQGNCIIQLNDDIFSCELTETGDVLNVSNDSITATKWCRFRDFKPNLNKIKKQNLHKRSNLKNENSTEEPVIFPVENFERELIRSKLKYGHGWNIYTQNFIERLLNENVERLQKPMYKLNQTGFDLLGCDNDKHRKILSEM